MLVNYEGTLRNLLDERLNDSELRDLCQDLGIDYDNLGGGSGKRGKMRELIEYLKRRHILHTLIKTIKETRPDIYDAMSPGIRSLRKPQEDVGEERKEEDEPPPPPPPVEKILRYLETEIPPLHLTLTETADRWMLSVNNGGDEDINRLHIVFQPSEGIIPLTPNRVMFGTVLPGQTASFPNLINIRVHNTGQETAVLQFEAIFKTPYTRTERQKGAFTIPIISHNEG